MSRELARVPSGDEQAVERAAAPWGVTDLVQYNREREAFGSFVAARLKEDYHFGKIPGAGERKTLLKPGAEEILRFYLCRAEYECVEKTVDVKAGLFVYHFRCRAVHIPSGAVLADGEGLCTSLESKYRYRYEYQDPGAPPEGHGWKKRKGKHGRSWFWSRRILNEDVADTWNTIVKMSRKRALVDAALQLGSCSDMFTQDVEEAGDGGDEAPTHEEFPEEPVRQPKLPADLIAAMSEQKDWAALVAWAKASDADLRTLDSENLPTVVYAMEQQVKAFGKTLDDLRAAVRGRTAGKERNL